MSTEAVRGRFAPTPSGRMHLGNVLAALLAWLDIRSADGTLILRMEDLDPDRCREEYAAQILRDLEWLGLDWDEGYGAGGPNGPYRQSRRKDLYMDYLRRLESLGLLYPCWCTRSQRLAACAPHKGDISSDGACPCRSFSQDQRRKKMADQGRPPAWRVAVPAETISFTDGVQWPYSQQLEKDCGDFIVRRSDGVIAYQLAVTVDDGMMGISHVVRGRDLLSSTPRQLWLSGTLGFSPASFWHTPMLLAPDGRRLSKRDLDMDMEYLRRLFTPEDLLGRLSFLLGLRPDASPVSPQELVASFSWDKIQKNDIVLRDPFPV
ncbi:MAG: tRNA glutamyl-Q(34) synthetase GluQRS [Oscillospiraceae bacterium]|nr:tRNA glutamyl-Q(34) synthetase GluQRS [Oscillospiraceae bacterium]